MLQQSAERGRGGLGTHLGRAVVSINPLPRAQLFTLSPLQARFFFCFFLLLNICSIVLLGNKSSKTSWLAK